MTRTARRIRIGIDAGALVFPAGGVRRYVRELLAALPEAASAVSAPVEFVAVGPAPGVDVPPPVLRGPRVVTLPTNLARAALALPWAIHRARLDLFHAPAYTAPLVGQTPVVLTIHDVSYARRPEFYAYRSDRARQWFYRRSALAATCIITDSEFSKREIVAAYGIPATRISVVPLGVDAPFVPADPGRIPGPALDFAPFGFAQGTQGTQGREGPGLRTCLPGDSTQRTGSSALPAGVRQPYVLHVGDLHPRRNVVAAARAVIEIHRHAATISTAPQLVCAGRDSGSEASLRATFEAAGFPGALRLTGPVSETELIALYQGAAAFIYPSLYEGFGLPVLEAMACGVPVVAMRAGSVPEVLGDTGILVDERNDRGLVEAITMLLANPDRAAAMGDRGLARARTFTWARTASATLDVYLECVNRARSV